MRKALIKYREIIKGYQMNVHTRLLILIFTLAAAGGAFASETETTYRHPNLIRDLFRHGFNSASLHLNIASYKPKLEQFTTILNAFGSPGIDAALMLTVSLEFEHTQALSSRLAIGYWTNDTEIPAPNASDLSAALIPFSVHLIYRPLLLHEFLPVYLGGGVGFSHLSVDGSALDLLNQQGIIVDEGNSGLTGYVLVGLRYPLLDDQLTVTLEAKRVLKTFTTEGAPPLDLEFDGTAIGLGVGLQF